MSSRGRGDVHPDVGRVCEGLSRVLYLDGSRSVHRGPKTCASVTTGREREEKGERGNSERSGLLEEGRRSKGLGDRTNSILVSSVNGVR